MKKRFLSLILASLMLSSVIVSSLTSCSEKAEDNQTDSETISPETEVQTETEEETELKYAADIPEGTDYDGAAFTILTYPNNGEIWGDVDWSAEEYTGEVLNDAVYQRMQDVNELLDVKITPAYLTSSGDTATLEASVVAQDNAYQLATIYMIGSFNLAQTGKIHELNSFASKGTLQLDAEWWDPNILSDISITGKNFNLTGDIGTMYKKSIGVVMFNKSILEMNQLENPYELMADGKWTIDKMIEMGSTISNDLDGNGVMDSKDQFGLLWFCDTLPSCMIGCGVQYFTKDENDAPVNSFYNDLSISVMEKLATLIYDKNLSYCWGNYGTEEHAFAMFRADQSLFYYGELHAVAEMRDMESPFGILTLPKYNEEQEGYHHNVNPHVAATYVIPITNVDYDMTGYVMDALGAASKNVLTPAYCDITLAGKVSRDEESQATLDIVFNTLRYDVGYMMEWGIGNMLIDMTRTYSSDLASRYKKLEKIITKQISKLLRNLEDVGE